MLQSEQLLDQKVPWLSPDWGALIVCENNSGGGAPVLYYVSHWPELIDQQVGKKFFI